MDNITSNESPICSLMKFRLLIVGANSITF